jgi:hypothetical protein
MSRLPFPLPALAAVGAAGGWAIGRFLNRGSAGGSPSPATAATASGTGGGGTSSDLFSSFGQAGLSFGDTSSPAGTLAGVLPTGATSIPTPDWTGLADLIAQSQAAAPAPATSSTDALTAALVAALSGGGAGAAQANPCAAAIGPLEQRISALNAAIGRLTPAWLKAHPASVPILAQYRSELAVAQQQLAAARAGQC